MWKGQMSTWFFGQFIVLSVNLTVLSELLVALLDVSVVRLESSALFRDSICLLPLLEVSLLTCELIGRLGFCCLVSSWRTARQCVSWNT